MKVSVMKEFKNFPQISALIDDEALKDEPLYLRKYFAKAVVAEFKAEFKTASKAALLDAICQRIKQFKSKDYQRLINATGVVIHTNLGRSVIDESLFDECKDLLCGNFNLEFDLQSGKRGERYGVVAEKLKMLFNAQDALIVNNNAAAVFLVLNSLANGDEVITSRGELVEIGGNFRMPEVMKSANAKLVEVGTTNKTHLKDYENALNENTALLLKTHKSNFAFKGFHSEVALSELYALSRAKNVPLYYDLGSGWYKILNKALIKGEESIDKLIKHCDIMSFSADKLFGSIQAGIILGQKRLIEKLKNNQILRMLRVDKITLILLNTTLNAYLEGNFDKITTNKLLNDNSQTIKEKALKAQNSLKVKCELKESKSLVGGGSMPDKTLPSFVLAFKGEALSLQKTFRKLGIIGRVENECFVLDFRTIKECEIQGLCKLINEEFSQ